MTTASSHCRVQHPRHADIEDVLGSTGRAHSARYHRFIRANTGHQVTSTKKGKQKAVLEVNAADEDGDEDAVIQVAVVWDALLEWFERVHDSREMPWRKRVDLSEMSRADKTQRAYEVWVSEIMLQQTQVATVVEYYKRWIEAFPTVQDLARADIEQVQERWKGLGYYSRATRLHQGAKTVMEEFQGRIPEDPAELEKIPGIGPYSAGAISSIAFARRSAMVDGNVTRVLSRLIALHAPATAKATTDYIWALAGLLVPDNGDTVKAGLVNKPGSWNQALMELGATVCTPKNPKCQDCPLEFACLAKAEVGSRAKSEGKGKARANAEPSDIEDGPACSVCLPLHVSRDHSITVYPMAKERKKQREEETAVCILEWMPQGAGKRQVLLVKRPEKGLLAGLDEFPAVDLPDSDSPSTPASRRKVLMSLVKSLLDEDMACLSSKSSGQSAPGPEAISIAQETFLEPVTQVYSHQIRTYTPIRLVLTSRRLPKLATRSKESSLVQSIAGRARWVDEDAVAGANTGGAVGKIWDLRQGAGPSKKVAVKKSAPKVNGGATLDTWMKRPAEPDFVPSPKYKKRVIVLSSDEEE